MKIKNKDRKLDVQDIIITKHENKSKVLLIINNQAITMFVNSVYTQYIFEKIEEYLQLLGDDVYVRI